MSCCSLHTPATLVPLAAASQHMGCNATSSQLGIYLLHSTVILEYLISYSIEYSRSKQLDSSSTSLNGNYSLVLGTVGTAASIDRHR